MTLAHRTLNAAKVPDAEGQVALAAVDGAVYGLDAATGKVLWRRFVGFDANPQAAGLSADAACRRARQRRPAGRYGRTTNCCGVEGATGRLRWRHAVGEPFDAYPVVADDRILVATRSGKLITIAAESGDSAGYVQLPQGLRVAPVVDPRRSMAYQVADHTNLFVLSLADGDVPAGRASGASTRQRDHGPGPGERLALGRRQRRRPRRHIARSCGAARPPRARSRC